MASDSALSTKIKAAANPGGGHILLGRISSGPDTGGLCLLWLRGLDVELLTAPCVISQEDLDDPSAIKGTENYPPSFDGVPLRRCKVTTVINGKEASLTYAFADPRMEFKFDFGFDGTHLSATLSSPDVKVQVDPLGGGSTGRPIARYYSEDHGVAKLVAAQDVAENLVASPARVATTVATMVAGIGILVRAGLRR
jgi:hypothetical protein